MPIGRELIRCIVVRSTAASFPIYAFNMASDSFHGYPPAGSRAYSISTVDDLMRRSDGPCIVTPSAAYLGSVGRESPQVVVPGHMALLPGGRTHYAVLYFANLSAVVHCAFAYRQAVSGGRERYYLGGGQQGPVSLKLNPDNATVRDGSLTSGECRFTLTSQVIYTAGKLWAEIYQSAEERVVWGTVVDPPRSVFGLSDRAHRVSFAIPYRPPGLNAWLNLVSFVDFGGVRMRVLSSDVESRARRMVLTAEYEVA